MAAVFRTSVLMCFFAFMLNIFDVHSQGIVEVVKRGDDETVVKFQDASSVVTEYVLEEMLMDITNGTALDVCSPHMTCGFLLFDENDHNSIGPFITYCNTCSEGYECTYDYRKLSQSYYVFKCKKAETKVGMDATAEETEPLADSKTRQHGLAEEL